MVGAKGNSMKERLMVVKVDWSLVKMDEFLSVELLIVGWWILEEWIVTVHYV